MDKAEYQQKLDQLTERVEEKDYEGALALAEAIDWKRVKSVKTLSMVADVYEHNRDYEKTKEVLTIAHTRTAIGRGVLSRLVEVCLKLGQVEQAEKYFREFAKVAQNDNTRCVLQYKLYQAKQAPLEAQIAILEEYREKEYTERWAYELATLYARAGEKEKCVEACDDLILWFSEGPYVLKALELKKQYEPLSENQQVLYTRERDAEAQRAREAAAAKAAEEKAKAEREAAEREAAEREAAEKAAAEAAAGEAEEADIAEDMPEADVAAEPAEEGGEPPVSGPGPEVEFVYGGDDEDDAADEEEEADDTPAHKGPEDLKNRLLRGFHNVFGGSKDKAKEEEEDEEEDITEEEAEPAEEDLTVRELLPEEAVYREGEEEPASQAVPAAPVTIEKAFDLDKFLNETENSFSEELSEGSYKGTTEEEPPRIDESVNTAEEEAVIESSRDLTETGSMTAVESIQAVVENVTLPEEAAAVAAAAQEEAVAEEPQEEAAAEETKEEPAAVKPQEETPAVKKPKYNEELEIPDEEPTEQERKTRTIPLGTIGQNTVPISIDKILSSETPEEQRIRIMNKTRPTRMSEEQRKIFTYFARIPGMDSQILEAISGVYEHAGERTSLHGNIGVMGAKGTGKTRLSEGLVITMCKDLDIKAAKIARISGEVLNTKDPARVVNIMAGGFLMIEDISKLNEETLEKLNRAMEFRTDCMIVIIEDEKTAMRAFLKDHPVFALKFNKLISIPVFTNDELVTFARTYAAENDCQVDDLGILALYTKIGNQQSEDNPVTISEVRDMVDRAIDHAMHGRRRGKRSTRRGDTARIMILHEKDFEGV